jgi:DNA mismatch endonuclease, patch repair protein
MKTKPFESGHEQVLVRPGDFDNCLRHGVSKPNERGTSTKPILQQTHQFWSVRPKHFGPNLFRLKLGDRKTAVVDTLSPHERSQRMGLVRGKNTKPELLVRRLVHRLGFRYRLHVSKLPGNPDLVFPRRRSVIFVHGCFWHRHRGCPLCRLPKSRLDFWKPKLEGNRKRDSRNQRELRNEGWRFLVVWECQLGNEAKLTNTIVKFLEPNEC